MGDVDTDGDVDIVIGNNGRNRLYLNDGRTFFADASAAQLSPDSDWSASLALGDVDADGDLDLVAGNWGQRDQLYLNDGAGTFQNATAARMPVLAGFTNELVLVDVDLDGDLDLAIVAGYGVERNRLYLNDGTGVFSDATELRMPSIPTSTFALAVGDVDGDEDPDLVIGDQGTPNRLFVNTHRQLSAPQFPILGRGYRIDFMSEPGYATSSHTGAAVMGFGLAPAPVVLPPLGTFFLNPPVFGLPPVSIPRHSGVRTLEIPVPSNPALLGGPLFLQAVIVNDATGQAHLTGYTSDVIRR